MIDRRRLLARTLALTAAPAIMKTAGAQAQPVIDSAPSLQREIDAAARLGRVVSIPSGISYVSRLRLASNARLVGAGRSSRLVAIGAGPMLSIERADSVAIENVAFDGGSRAPGGESGLIEARDVADLRLLDCAMERVAGHGARLERCGGRIERSNFRSISESAVFSTDGAGLSVVDNRIEDCANNGVQIWRTSQGDDGAVIRGNHIARIRADRGGEGPYGNAISVFRAGGVLCEGNVIRACAFSAIRDNAGSDASIRGNSCADLGEVAIYVEFGFTGAVVEGNLVDGAAVGISITNFDQGGRLAACSGNVVRNLDRARPQGAALSGIGIHAEADTVVSGNTVDRAGGPGLLVGYGAFLRNVLATGNVVSDCDIGVAVSVAPGAGSAAITGNTIARARRGAIVGMAWEKIAAADLVAQAASYPQLTIAGNQLR
ncbi:MAG: TIGR03808 family TAT-translocated repetitive protein [Hyphomicrobiales bacterium]